jgi:hypothetical protein
MAACLVGSTERQAAATCIEARLHSSRRQAPDGFFQESIALRYVRSDTLCFLHSIP